MVKSLQNDADLDSTLSRGFLDGTLDHTAWLEARQSISLPFADVQSQEWCFDGIRVGYSDWHFHEAAKVDYQSEIVNEVVTLCFNLKGKMSSCHPGADAAGTIELGNYEHNIFYSASATGSLESARQQLTTFMIQFSAAPFLRLTQDANDVLKQFGERILLKKPWVLSKKSLPLSGHMLSAIESMLHCPFEAGLKRMFFFSKSIELLVMQAEAYNQAARDTRPFVKTGYDREQIMYAQAYLKAHIDNPPTLPELSRICGINEYKLKKGFKEVYGNTVFGYLSDHRLEMAMDDLMQGKASATEIAASLGYSSSQHFSRAFKTKFGVSPGEMKRR